MTQLLLLSFTLVVILLLAVLGRAPERWVAGCFTLILIVTPCLQDFEIGNLRWAIALSSIALFAALLTLALTYDRWWLIIATGCQLMAVATYVVALLRADTLLWSGVTVRWVVWFELLIIALFGVWEARRLTQAAPEPASELGAAPEPG